jgi:hypothetical protein
MMSIIETFTARDKDGNSYEVNIYGAEYSPIQGRSSLVRDYSLASTGEVLAVEQKNPLVLKIKSNGALIQKPLESGY